VKCAMFDGLSQPRGVVKLGRVWAQ